MKLKLCRGKGNGRDTACLATAVAILSGEPWALDDPSCLCPVIRDFIIGTNDAMPDELRHQFYGDLPWLLLGTRTDDYVVVEERTRMLVEFARQFEWATRPRRHDKPSVVATSTVCRAASLPPPEMSLYDSGEWERDPSRRMLVYVGTGQWPRVAPMCRKLVVDMAMVGGEPDFEPVVSDQEIERMIGVAV